MIICASVILVWTLSPKRWPRIAAGAGLLSFAAGVALYLVVIFVALNYYDEQPDPTWLTALTVLAFVLAGGGLLAIVSAALGAARRVPTSKVTDSSRVT
jgi:hypothetical protein